MREGIKDYRDAAFKLIFDEPELFVQFLDGFSPIKELKGLPPEAVEDMTERFTMLDQEERDADTVKRIRIPKDGKEMYVISIVEHESRVNYRMPFKLLQYMTFVWAEYEKERQRQNKGCVYQKGFKYPPILPVVLYDGRSEWTAERSMRGKVEMGDVFAPYIPSFDYTLVDLREYTIGELSRQENALSLMLILDKLQFSDEFATIMERLPAGYIESLKVATPQRVLQVLSDIVRIYMARAGLARDKVEKAARTVAEGRLESMFSVFAENFEKEKQAIRQEVRHEERVGIAKEMFEAGESIRKIKRFTKLPDDTLRVLQKQYAKDKDAPER